MQTASSPAAAATGMQQRVEALEAEVAQLRATVQQLCDALGVAPTLAASEPAQD